MNSHGTKINICMLGHKRIPSREGGVELVVEELASRMVKKGFSVTCFNRKGHHVSGNSFDNNEVNNHEYKGIILKTVFAIDFKGLAAITSSFFGSVKAAIGRYDIIHYHAEGPCLFMWIPKLFDKKCVATIHGLDHQRAKWGRLARFCILLGEKVAVKYADEIIVLSNSARDYFKENYNRDTVVIPNGVNSVEVNPANIIKNKYNLQKDSYILFLGRIVPEKGIIYLIDAFSNVLTKKKLVIAGGSSDSEDFFSFLKRKVSTDKRIIFTGFVQGQELAELYSNAYMYVLPSDLEGMPLSLLEAMSYGNCCLTSDIAECSEVTEDKALYFKKSNVQDLQDKLQYLCDHKEAVLNYKNCASEFICNKYNWDSIAAQTINIYKKVLK